MTKLMAKSLQQLQTEFGTIVMTRRCGMNSHRNPILTTLVFSVSLCMLLVGPSWGMPGTAHNELAQRLLNTPASQGGSQGLTMDQARAVGRWMDNPTSKTGQYINRSVGRPVHPINHGHLRHNPVRVAKAMSGNGTVDPAKLNVARLHKIADVAHNKAAVDGWKITSQMRKEAQVIIDHVAKHHRLPKQLPGWVDQSGPIITERAKSIAAAGKAKAAKQTAGLLIKRTPRPMPMPKRLPPGSPMPRPTIPRPDFPPVGPRPMPKVPPGHAGPAALAKAAKMGGGVVVGRIIIEGGIATIQYVNGGLSTGQYNQAITATGIKALGSGALTSVALICFTNPGTAVVFVVAVGACIVVDTTYGLVRSTYDKSDEWREFSRRLPPEFQSTGPIGPLTRPSGVMP
jgi:hypothetical protein